MATTLSEDIGSRPEVSIIYQGSSSCRDVKKLVKLQPCETQCLIGMK